MKWLLIFFLGMVIVPALAQDTQVNQTVSQKLDTSLKILQTEHKTSDTLAFFYATITFVAGTIIVVIIAIGQKRQSSKIETMTNEVATLVSNVKKILDEQEKSRKEHHDLAIGRLRSFLASLYSAIDSLMKLDIDPNVPEDQEMDRLLEFKNEMVTQLDHVVTQSGTILEQDYLQRLTDIIEMSRRNPKPSQTDDVNLYLDIDHCPGILSQIDDLLKIMPNPPTKSS